MTHFKLICKECSLGIINQKKDKYNRDTISDKDNVQQ